MADKLPESITITNAKGKDVTFTSPESVAMIQREIDAGRMKKVADPIPDRVITEAELPFLTDSDLEQAADVAARNYDNLARLRGVELSNKADKRAKREAEAAAKEHADRDDVDLDEDDSVARKEGASEVAIDEGTKSTAKKAPAKKAASSKPASQGNPE